MPVGKKGFLGAFLGDHRVAALQPSSGFVIKRVLRHLDARRIKTVVEYGPGNGVATFAILGELPASARYLAIERNHELAVSLRDLDERLIAVEGDVREAGKIQERHGFTRADAVIASIPFTYFKPREREAIVASAKRLVGDEGVFIVFHQYSLLMLPYLKRHFKNVRVELELLNVLPCFVFICK